MRPAEIFTQCDQVFNDYVSRIGDDWDRRVPATPDWTVRDLVVHVGRNNAALAAALGGNAVDFDENEVARNPASTWIAGAEAAEAAASAETDPARMVETPMGAMTAGDFLLLQSTDRLVHGWDLAGAIGADLAMEPALVQAVYDFTLPRAEAGRSGGLFGPEVPVPSGASVQDKLLGLTGRDANLHAPEPDGTDQSKADLIHRS